MSITRKKIIACKKGFGINLKRLRESKGMSQLDLASIINVDKTSISRIENGRTNITLITALKLSIALEKNIKDLFEF